MSHGNGIQWLIQPIRIIPLFYIRQLLAIPFIQRNLLIHRRRRVHSRRLLDLQLLHCITHVIITQIGNIKRGIYIITYLHLPVRRGIRCNNHHPVGSSRTINCRCRRILQQGNRSHPIRIHIIHLLGRRLEPVNDKYRRIRVTLVFTLYTGNTPGTPDLELGNHVRIRTC